MLFLHIIFIILLAFSLILLVVLAINPGVDKKTGKPNKRWQAVTAMSIFAVLFILFTAITTPHNKPKPIPLSSLNSQAAALLTTATNNTAALMTTGQADAAQKDALTTNPPSAFEQWRKTVQKSTDSNTDNAYTKASALYTNNKQSIPAALKAWKTDNTATYDDISVWQLGEVTLLVSQQGGTTSSELQSDEKTAQTDLTQYQTDLGKARNDISGLTGKVSQAAKPATPTPATSKPTPQTTAPAPTVPLTTLNAQAVALFNPVLSDLEQQMAQGEADAAQSNAGNVSSTFHSWETAEQDKQNVTNNNEVTSAYNNADNAYYNAHQNEPDAVSNWDTDAGNLPGDITEWANAEQMVEGDEVMGSPSSDDQQTANSDLQQYKSDLSKAQADVSQL